MSRTTGAKDKVPRVRRVEPDSFRQLLIMMQPGERVFVEAPDGAANAIHRLSSNLWGAQLSGQYTQKQVIAIVVKTREVIDFVLIERKARRVNHE
jgi:hypothetical protein